MPRTDENGRGLQAVLSYLLDRAVPATEIYGALGIARSTYHGRLNDEDFPDAEECRLVAEHFNLNPLELLITFGLITNATIEELGPGENDPPKSTKNEIKAKKVKSPKLRIRKDTAPL